MKSTVCINPLSGSLLVMFLAGACAPSPDVLQATTARVGWSAETTRSPKIPDAAEPDPGPDPEPAGTGGSGATGGAGGSGSPSPVVDAAAPRRDAAVVVPTTPPPTGPAAACQLSFQVTTVTFGGDYAPRNVGAIWIADGAGKFVKSLVVWGRRRLSHLTRWESASGGNTVDAVTSASASSHSTRMATWNCNGLDGKPVPGGSYVVNVEFTEQNAFGRMMMPVPFMSGGAPVDVSPPDQANFKGIHLKVTP
jgi:hypothetical protein